jgi:hypothetical protein
VSPPPAGGNAVPLEAAAALLKCTPRWIQMLAKEGWIAKADRGRYPLVGLIHGYIDWRDDADKRATRKQSENKVRDAKADLVQLQIEERSRKLVDEARTEALATCDLVIGGIRSDLVSLPARITSDLAMRQRIETAIDDVLRAAAKRAQDAASGDDEGGDASAAATEVDA